MMKSLFILVLLTLSLFSLNKSSLECVEKKDNETNLEFALKSTNKTPIFYVYDVDWAPFEWKNNVNRHSGVIIDILNIISKKTEIPFVAVATNSWTEAVQLAENNQIDMYSAIPFDKERSEYMNFTNNDIFTYQAALVKNQNDKNEYINLDQELASKRIAIVKSSSLGNFVKDKYPMATYLEVEKTEEGFRAVENGLADLFAINSATADYMIFAKGFKGLRIAQKLDHIFRLKIALSKNVPLKTLNAIDEALKTISNTQRDAIYNRWAKPKVIQAPINWRYIIYIIIFIFIIILFFIYRQYLLKKKNKELEKISMIDPLTQIYNRRKFDDIVNYIWRHNKRAKTKVAILMIDIDYFKNFNDFYGHQAGDDALVKVAQTLLFCIRRKVDIVARYGGEEFIMIVDETNEEYIIQLTKRILDSILELKIKHEMNKVGEYLSVSIGATIVLPSENTSSEVKRLIAKADEALYTAKAKGRNRAEYVF